MAKLKTSPNNASVEDFINAVENNTRKADALRLLDIMKEITGEQAVMWGDSIIGFGQYRYIYDSGRENDWMRIAFSPRKTSLAVYIMDGFTKYNTLLTQLGKHKIGKSCLHIKRLDQIDLEVLKQLIKDSFEYMVEQHP